jgi:hypothetical protein
VVVVSEERGDLMRIAIGVGLVVGGDSKVGYSRSDLVHDWE